MAFKLGKEKIQIRTSKTTPIFRKKLKKGVVAEANMDGSIYVDKSVPKDSAMYKKAIKHEQKHIDQIKSGKAAYDDNTVTWKNNVHIRKDGKIFYKNKWYEEGDKNLPWEKEAIKAEKQ